MCETTLLDWMMDVQSHASPRMADDSDEDDKPLSFKRNNTVTKQTHSNPEVKKSSSQNNDSKSGGQHSDILSSNGQSTSAQNSSSKSPPMRSPLASPQASSSSVGRSPLASPKASPNASPAVKEEKPVRKPPVEPRNDDEDSDDDKPLSSKIQRKSNAGASTRNPYDSDDEKPLSSIIQKNGSAIRDIQARKSTGLNKRPSSEAKSSGQSSVKKPKLTNASMPTNSNSVPAKIEIRPDDDENDQAPISQRIKKPSPSGSKSPSVIQKVAKVGSSSLKKTNKNSKKAMKKSKYSKSSKIPPESGEGKKWTSLEHNGVIFPPPYKPHGVPILYDGKPVDLTPEQEEVATMYAVMLGTNYLEESTEENRHTFKENFWSEWRKFLGKNHVIQNFKLCIFKPIEDWHYREKLKKKQMSKEEKKAIKEEKMKLEEKYTWAIVDGVKEKVGNFRVEPPGLFRGRGDHPKMGKLKKRLQPSDFVINIGKDAPVPECPIPGQSWKEVRHDNTVAWLACWYDPIPEDFKYVQLAASSSLKGQSDKEKYEKARRLKGYIQGIRTAYTKDFGSEDETKKQIAVATYLIDKLALRAGNEKDDDEAETFGCCTLKVEHVEPKPPNMLKFDFFGKDSIKYENEVEVEIPVYKAIQQFRSGKTGGDDLFDKLDTSKLNAHLKGLMPGLTAKVFRTYNASITLDEMLSRETKDGDVVQKLAVYQRANKEVAIICNHQRNPNPKTHEEQIDKLNAKIAELKAVLEELQTDLSRAKKGKPPLKSDDGKPKRNMTPEAIEKKISQTNAKIEKIEQGKATKEDLKMVALGTSKINYLDPRITVAWCKRHEVPIEKIFTKTLLAKFAWSMDDDPSFRF